MRVWKFLKATRGWDASGWIHLGLGMPKTSLLCYSGLFLVVVIILLILTQKALYSPWGRMMRAIRDNEEAANAMGKNVVKQHLLIFVLGSAIVGIAGAMLVTQDGLFTPGSYRPLRYTFLIWVMVIVGGSGNNFGAILGGFVVWFLWIEAAPNWIVLGQSNNRRFRRHAFFKSSFN